MSSAVATRQKFSKVSSPVALHSKIYYGIDFLRTSARLQRGRLSAEGWT